MEQEEILCLALEKGRYLKYIRKTYKSMWKEVLRKHHRKPNSYLEYEEIFRDSSSN